MNQKKEDAKTLTLTEAQNSLGVSRGTLWRIIRKYKITTFNDVLDSRVKRVRIVDIQNVWNEANRVRQGIAA